MNYNILLPPDKQVVDQIEKFYQYDPRTISDRISFIHWSGSFFALRSANANYTNSDVSVKEEFIQWAKQTPYFNSRKKISQKDLIKLADKNEQWYQTHGNYQSDTRGFNRHK